MVRIQLNHAHVQKAVSGMLAQSSHSTNESAFILALITFSKWRCLLISEWNAEVGGQKHTGAPGHAQVLGPRRARSLAYRCLHPPGKDMRVALLSWQEEE